MVLATGVALFALLVIFSLMPIGLSILHDANRATTENELFNTVANELDATPFAKLDEYTKDPGGTRFPAYYDIEGLLVAQGVAVAPANAIFTVRCKVALPELNGELRRATISIGFHIIPPADPTDVAAAAAAGSRVTKRSVLLANRGN